MYKTKLHYLLLQLTITLSTKNISAWAIHLHHPHHWSNSHLMLYGQELINVQSSDVSGTWSSFQIDPLEVHHINQNTEPCISEEDKVIDIWECMTAHMYSKINCTLPWVAETKDKDVHLCSLPAEYDLYHATIIEGIYQNSEYIEKVAKCTPGCKRTEYSAKLFYTSQEPTLSEKWRLSIVFVRDKFPVKEQFYIYGTANLIADFGGYLGLLLGYSLLGFYDTLMDFFGYMIKILKRR